MTGWMRIYLYADLLAREGLDDLEAVRSWSGTPIKLQRGRRDVCRLVIDDQGGQPRTIFLKRNLKPYRKHSLGSFLRSGRVMSAAEIEADSLAALQKIGVSVSPCVAVGADKGLLGERFSFIMTEAAPGVPLDQILAEGLSPADIKRIGACLMPLLAHVHRSGYGIPTLMARHLFVDGIADQPRICFIDVDRLVRPRPIGRQRVRDLAQLHFSVPLAHLSVRQRIRMLRLYTDGDRVRARWLLRRIARRTTGLLLRRKRRAKEFLTGLTQSQAEAVIRRADEARRTLTWVARSTNIISGVVGVGLLWLAYSLGTRDLIPLDEAHEWSELAEHLEQTAPHLHPSTWLLSAPGLFGLGLVIASLVAARWLLLPRHRN